MAEPARDLYAILGVARDVDADALRAAYRKLARKYHPDVNPGDKSAEEQFKEISRAYDVLSDAEKRRNYDEFGEVSLEAGFDAKRAREAKERFEARFGRGGGAGFEPPGGESFHFDDLDDLLGRFYGGRGGERSFRMRGADAAAGLELDFLDALRGGTHSLTLQREGPDGQLRSENLTVRIRPGVRDGGRIRIPGRGGAGIGGGPSGDLWVRLHVRPHPVFSREGDDLHMRVPISVREAVLGAKIEVPLPEGRATVSVPAGTDSGRKLRLRGKGAPDPESGTPGDLYVTVEIRVPRGLDEAERKRLDELLASHDEGETLRKGLFR
ncbi:MAG TPA: DnaJ C-terminal domain-containing protein [Myxococcota bacterium]|nr:DnaJ C-terminal domain-containing protein [Myxococcota bacterium]